MKILCVIPSRMNSTRLPKKPLLPIQGKPMVQWVYENAKKCHYINEVIVATDSDEIATTIKNCGGRVQLTSPDLPTGSDRVAFVADSHPEFDVVLNLQGDEPFISANMLEEVLSPYLEGQLPQMTTLAAPITVEDYHRSGVVKVITDCHQNAIYFSRAPIPYFREQISAPVYRHIGLYAFRRDFLLYYTKLPQTLLEKTEALEQLRVLEHGHRIRVCLTKNRSLEINTQEELAAAQSFALTEWADQIDN